MTISVACGETRVELPVGDPLNPELHKANIVAIDAILFEDGGLGDLERKDVESRLLALGDVAAAEKGNRYAAHLAPQFRTLAAAAARTRVGTPLLDSALREHWLRLRSSLFDDAWWFRRSSADPIETMTK